ncbi:MAG: threonylcarbamoyl-AMP synthase [Candidatus Eremiobacteraeota bacterium]|nr:threonylcarbamoyl-AMP synthase [Candidatus Eremiobacteraeota bacterium]
MLVIQCSNGPGKAISRAVEVLTQGGVIVYPTDTVYGMGCDLLNKRAIERIYQLKKLHRRKPLSFICEDLKQISEYAQLSNPAYKMMKRLLPGPFTFILNAKNEVPKIVMTKQRTVGIRVPDNDICLGIVRELGRPLVNTSASGSEDEVVSDPDQIEEQYHQADLMLADGLLESDPSTVVDFTGDVPVVVRQGRGDLSGYL